MKKIVTVAAVLLMGLLLTAMEVSWIQNEKNREMVGVIGVIKPVQAGEILESGNLKEYELPKNHFHDGYYQSLDAVAGKTVMIDLAEKTLIFEGLLRESAYNVPLDGNGMTALKLEPESALCWTLDIGESVQVVQAGDDGSYKDLGTVLVKGLFDNYMEAHNVPAYVLVEGEIQIISKIIQLRETGRIELIKQAFNQTVK